MFISKLSDAVVQWLVPQTSAAACLAPEACNACSVVRNVCDAGLMWEYRYATMVNDCNGRCTIKKTTYCGKRMVGYC